MHQGGDTFPVPRYRDIATTLGAAPISFYNRGRSASYRQHVKRFSLARRCLSLIVPVLPGSHWLSSRRTREIKAGASGS